MDLHISVIPPTTNSLFATAQDAIILEIRSTTSEIDDLVFSKVLEFLSFQIPQMVAARTHLHNIFPLRDVAEFVLFEIEKNTIVIEDITNLASQKSFSISFTDVAVMKQGDSVVARDQMVSSIVEDFNNLVGFTPTKGPDVLNRPEQSEDDEADRAMKEVKPK